MSLITQLTISDIPIFIILLGALFLYFGVIIGNTKVVKYDKNDYYIEGLYFFIFYIVIPFVASFYLKGQLDVSTSLLVPIQVVVLFVLLWIINAQIIRKYELLDIYRNKFEKSFNQIAELPFVGGIIKLNENFQDTYKKGFDWLIYKIPITIGNKYILFIFPFMTIISNFKLYDSGELLLFGLSMLLSFCILAYVASAYGHSDIDYVDVTVCLVDGKTIVGRMLYSGEYIKIIKNGTQILINKDKINCIEASLLSPD